MITISPVVLQKEDGTSERITIEAVSYEEDGQNVFNGIYTLTASREVPDAESENDPMASIAAGEIAMHREDPPEWLYFGDYLSNEEQEAVVRAIQAELV